MGRCETIGSITLGNPDWGVWVLAGVSLFFVSFLVSTLQAPIPFRWKWGLFSLKVLAVLLLAVCLLDPQWTSRHLKPGENLFLLLADQSASLNLNSARDSQTSRGERFRSLLTDPESPWLIRLGQDFEVRRYRFGETVGTVESFQEMAFEEPASQLGTALKTLQSRFRGQPLAGIFLCSDGNWTDSLPDLTTLGVPVFPIVPDGLGELNDLSIESVSVTQTNFEDAPVTVQGRFTATGGSPEAIQVTLKEMGKETGKEFTGESASPAPASSEQTQTITAGPAGDFTARFQVRPERRGVLFYELSVESKEKNSQEVTDRNNRQWIAVHRDPHVSRILYVGGRPNWEHKFLGRALQVDDQLQLVSLVRIARKEARFDFRGRMGERNNSLFRGFNDNPDDDTEDFSQPVLVRLNTRDAAELSDGFPKTKSDLYQYDALIIDDTEAAFFTRDQLALIERFVSERGGGLLMLGGRDTFRQGKWSQTPVADLLPVYLNRVAAPLTGPLKWSLTRDGWLEPWTRSRETEQAEKARLGNAPPLTILSATSEIKPGARTLATVQNDQGQSVPSLVVQTYGEGRSAALLVGDLWKWGIRQAETDPDDAGKFWRQLTRWMVGDVPRRISALVESTDVGGLPAMRVRVKLRDKEYQPLDGDRVLITIRQPDGVEIKLDAQASLTAAGTYEAVHVCRQAGPYLAEIVTSGVEGESFSTQVGWASDPAAQEFQKTAFDRAALDRLASETGGEVVSQSDLPKFVTQLQNRDLPVMETASIPLWHQPWILLAALVLLCLEWGLRRWKGLA